MAPIMQTPSPRPPRGHHTALLSFRTTGNRTGSGRDWKPNYVQDVGLYVLSHAISITCYQYHMLSVSRFEALEN